jgi:hypothetical protein
LIIDKIVAWAALVVALIAVALAGLAFTRNATAAKTPTLTNYGICVGGHGHIVSPLLHPRAGAPAPCPYGRFVPVAPQLHERHSANGVRGKHHRRRSSSSAQPSPSAS